MATTPPAPMPGAPTGARPVRLHNYLAYGSMDVLGAGSMAVISGWILFFYTTFCGLTAVQAASIFAIARLLDAVWSPLIGYISDNFGRTALGKRFGRRRFFVLAAIPLVPSFALMWVSGASFWYYLVSYVFFELVYASVIIPYETLAAEMSSDYRTKAKFAGSRILFGQASAILAGFLPAWLIAWLGSDSADTFLYMGIVFSVLFVVVAFTLWAFSWERPLEETGMLEERGPSPGVGSAFKTLYRNLFSTLRIRAFRLHLGMYLGGYISQDVFNAAFTYFVVFALGGTVAAVASLLGWMYVVQFVAVILAINLALKTTPSFAYQLAAASLAIGVATFLIMYGAGVRAGAALLWVPVVFAGLGRGALNYIPWATYNYMADVDEIVTGKRREGTFAGVMTFVRKATQSLAVLSVGFALEAGGLVPGATEQSPEAIRAIILMMGIGTIGVLVMGVLVSFRFKLTPHTHAILMDEIERFKHRPDTPPSDQARAVAEDLSGWRHDQLWGRNPVA